MGRPVSEKLEPLEPLPQRSLPSFSIPHSLCISQQELLNESLKENHSRLTTICELYERLLTSQQELYGCMLAHKDREAKLAAQLSKSLRMLDKCINKKKVHKRGKKMKRHKGNKQDTDVPMDNQQTQQ